MMRILLYFFLLILLGSCSKLVYTVYYENENQTIFSTHKMIVSTPDQHDLILEVSKICPGRTMCSVDELKLELIQESRFAYLKGKDFFIQTDKERIDLNHRDYRFSYDMLKKAKDGTDGVAIEKWTVWIKFDDFRKIANSNKIYLEIGQQKLPMGGKLIESWAVIIDHEKLIDTMDSEQKRSYGKYSKAPASELEAREIFDRKAKMEAEQTTWELVKDSKNAEDFEYFLKKTYVLLVLI